MIIYEKVIDASNPVIILQLVVVAVLYPVFPAFAVVDVTFKSIET